MKYEYGICDRRLQLTNSVLRYFNRMLFISDMIEKFAGINHRLENVLQDRKEQPVVEKEKGTTDTKNPEPPAKAEEPKILKGLKGLPPALLQTILAKEKEKSVKDVTQNTEQRKRIELEKGI